MGEVIKMMSSLLAVRKMSLQASLHDCLVAGDVSIVKYYLHFYEE